MPAQIEKPFLILKWYLRHFRNSPFLRKLNASACNSLEKLTAGILYLNKSHLHLKWHFTRKPPKFQVTLGNIEFFHWFRKISWGNALENLNIFFLPSFFFSSFWMIKLSKASSKSKIISIFILRSSQAEIVQLRAKFQTAKVSCSRFMIDQNFECPQKGLNCDPPL